MQHTVSLTVTLRADHADLASLERAADTALAESAYFVALASMLLLGSATACRAFGTCRRWSC